MKKAVPFHFGDAELAAFEKLKELVTSAPVLILPNSTQPFRSRPTVRTLPLVEFYPSFQRKMINGTQ
jgi:hypothetical protein